MQELLLNDVSKDTVCRVDNENIEHDDSLWLVSSQILAHGFSLSSEVHVFQNGQFLGKLFLKNSLHYIFFISLPL